MKRYALLLVVLLSIFTSKIQAQQLGNIKFKDKWSVSLDAGLASGWCDVESNWFGYYTAKPAFGIILTKQLSTVIDLRSKLILTSLKGNQPNRDRYFLANTFEWNIGASVDFTRLSFGIDPNRKLILHGFFTLGFCNFSSILRNISRDSILNATGYDNNGNYVDYKTVGVVNSGINLQLKISEHIDFLFENSWTVMNTDLLDGHLGGFSHDIYSFTSLGVVYKFNFRKNIPYNM